MNAEVSVNIAAINYNHTYSLQLQFDVQAVEIISIDKPVTLKVENNKHYVYLKIIKGSSMIPYLEYEKDGAFVKMEEVSADADSRIVKFEASNIGTPTKVKVQVSAGTHQATYEFRIVADTNTIRGSTNETRKTYVKTYIVKTSNQKRNSDFILVTCFWFNF